MKILNLALFLVFHKNSIIQACHLGNPALGHAKSGWVGQPELNDSNIHHQPDDMFNSTEIISEIMKNSSFQHIFKNHLKMDGKELAMADYCFQKYKRDCFIRRVAI